MFQKGRWGLKVKTAFLESLLFSFPIPRHAPWTFIRYRDQTLIDIPNRKIEFAERETFWNIQRA